MRILVCSNIYPPGFVGGAEIIAHQQALALSQCGHEVEVFAGDIREIGDRHAIRSEMYDGLTVHRVRLTPEDFQEKGINFSHAEVERHFVDIASRFRPTIVHCHNLVGLSVALPGLAKATCGARVVVTLHDHWGYCFKNTLQKSEGVGCEDITRCHECMDHISNGRGLHAPIRMRKDFVRVALEQVDAFVSPSRYLADHYVYAGFPASRMHVIWNGIDIDRFRRHNHVPSESVRFSFLGHFGRHKGIATLLKAFALLPNPRSVNINLVGDGDQEPVYKGLLSETGLARQVRFWGKLDNADVLKVYAETDVLVLPSIWHENQPVSITEAMACGLPVLASRMGGIPELVEDGVNGFTFRAGDIEDLASKMQRLIADRVLREQLGDAGRQRIGRHTFSAQVGLLDNLYSQLLEDASIPPERDLVVCLGEELMPECRIVMETLSQRYPQIPVRFVMADWPADPQLERAAFVWIVDPATKGELIQRLANLGLPLVAPRTHVIGSAACERYQCGLTFDTANEAAACIAYLQTHPHVRGVLARNARLFALS